MIIKYLIPFITSFFLTVILVIPFSWLAKKINWRGRKSLRHIHSSKVFRIGGIVMIVAFNAAIFFNKDLVITPEICAFSLGTLAFLVIGIRDDFKEIYWKIQLFSQIAVAFFIFVVGIRILYITNPLTGGIINLDVGLGVLFSAILVVVWVVTVINAINWVDGIDGLSGGITLIASAVILILSLRPEVNQPPIAILSAILFGTIGAFLVFNFNPSRILAGTSGSMFMGFSLAVLAIFSGTKIATALLVLTIPIIDSFWVIGERIKKRVSIFKPDRNHLHYKLMELGWSQKKIAFSYWGITFVIAAIALNTRAIGKGIALIATALIMIFILVLINKKLASLNRK